MMRATDISYNALQSPSATLAQPAQTGMTARSGGLAAAHVRIDEVRAFVYAKHRAVNEELKGNPSHAGQT